MLRPTKAQTISVIRKTLRWLQIKIFVYSSQAYFSHKKFSIKKNKEMFLVNSIRKTERNWTKSQIDQQLFQAKKKTINPVLKNISSHKHHETSFFWNFTVRPIRNTANLLLSTNENVGKNHKTSLLINFFSVIHAYSGNYFWWS